jgi:sarcosine oxidase delta subunit
MIDINHGVFTPTDTLYFIKEIDGILYLKEAHVVQIWTKNDEPSDNPCDYIYKLKSKSEILTSHIDHESLCKNFFLDRKTAVHEFVLLQIARKNRIYQECEVKINEIDKLLKEAIKLEAVENGEVALFN